jgi:hypothetical protein
MQSGLYDGGAAGADGEEGGDDEREQGDFGKAMDL